MVVLRRRLAGAEGFRGFQRSVVRCSMFRRPSLRLGGFGSASRLVCSPSLSGRTAAGVLFCFFSLSVLTCFFS
jgi:hypothetical protein